MTIDDIHERLMHLRERIHEVSAEMANERAMFGDSGPGSQLRLSEMRADAAHLSRMLEVTEPGCLAFFNATREQWQKTWRDARVIRSQHREPKAGSLHPQLIWFAFNLVDTRPWQLPLRTAQDRLQWRRIEEDGDIPF